MIKRDNWRRTLEAICIPIGAILVALFLFGIFCALVGANPLQVYSSIYRAAFGRWTSFQNTLIRAAPLMLSALCTALPARLGLVIIGNEGALVMGGLAAAAMGLSLGTAVPPVMVQLGMAVAGLVAGGIWIAFAGALRHYRGVNETISSLLLNYIAIALLNHLVEGPMKDPSSLNKPSTFPIPDINMLPSLPGTRVHYGLIYGFIACAIAYFLIQRTTFGFAARVAGGNIRAARIAGLPVGKLTVAICFLAGSCAGLAGMVEVAAIHSRANQSLNAGYGYGGILVAFVARHNPLAVILISILLGGIIASGGILQRSHGLPDATVLVFQGLVFLTVLFSDSLYGRIPFFQEKAAPSVSPQTVTV
ncbi:ABC transporter permease [Desertifilum sp. FACHB-1129]|uniref:ABC transporter permease n=1 Tax=Desertifilum tharense IPPAS B-1220 TaxID=1781255 RepID=A0A1E5QIM8_9CYAN|nr:MULTISPECIES: ABC transporter permease [Desertifilum]MDA0210142.1 ABC transporter permease [Cyanobacteria bacterium FC1]MBD2312553.1 ABC transporter permease [Desertifilum sp. FACHB-1129]MBD2320547.1 ABC transporter permease [Desertifilum sp. FACHB-866]MBD2330675.1 ABC transporter permease [Desertifilum sp. FACHB-868]OEJ74471.1 ABC transporter permease [Desertifilum tharense IPPAS B-1220]